MKEISCGICLYKINVYKNKQKYNKDIDIKIFLNKTSKISDLNFFKGKIEKEDKKDFKLTAIREFKEETGIEIEYSKLEKCFIQKNKRKDIYIYLVDFNNLEIYKNEIELFNKNLKLEKKEIYEANWYSIFNINKEEIVLSKNQKKLFILISTYLAKKQFWKNIISI